MVSLNHPPTVRRDRRNGLGLNTRRHSQNRTECKGSFPGEGFSAGFSETRPESKEDDIAEPGAKEGLAPRETTPAQKRLGLSRYRASLAAEHFFLIRS